MSEPQRLSGSRWASGGTAMDPVRNPYAPGAGQRPPELTGRDREIGQFEVVLERVARGRPERSRSEERRVGKEWRSRWGPAHHKNKAERYPGGRARRRGA